MNTICFPRAIFAAAMLATLLLGGALPCGAELKLYVAPNGSDTWSGTRPDAAGDDGPFATVHRARDEVRRAKAEGRADAGVTVLVKAGTYELSEPLVLGPEDSGAADAPVVFRGSDTEKPLLVGARKITGFRPWKGEVLQCDLKGTALEGVAFRQLFFRGERMTLARYPNKDPEDPHFGNWAHVLDVDGLTVRDHFNYTTDVEKNWTNVERARVCIHPGHDWAWSVVGVKSVDRQTRTLHLARNVAYDLRVGDRYYVENLLEELDSPGEWYLDTGTSTLYFWPPAGLETGDVMASVMPSVVRLEGASHVWVDGFIIEACDGDAVVVRDCQDCVVAGSVVRNCGSWGIVISGGRRSQAIGNDIYATGSGGISLSGGDRKTLERGDNVADNNYIHHVAEFAKTYNTGINVSGVGNTASHNLVHDTYHAGITLSGNENVVEYNHVHHTNLGSADTGGIYFCSRDWTQRGNVIRYNLWHHVGGFGKTNSWAPVRDGKVEFAYPHFTWGIYLDDPTTGTLVYGNILYSVPVCGLHNHGGRDNTFQNNIVVDCPALQAGQLSPDWNEWPPIKDRLKAVQYEGSPYLRMYPELGDYPVARPEEMTGLKFRNNIIYYTEEGSRWLREKRGHGNRQELYSMHMTPEDFARNEWDSNVIYAPEGLDLFISANLAPKPSGQLSWEQWQALGVDEHSVLADPLFVDAANHDYRLRPDSPALKLGFEQIPVEKIGPQYGEWRASWPVAEAPGASRLGDFHTVRHFQLPGYEPVPAARFSARGGLPNFAAKVRGGQAIRVAYFGGGIHYSNGWAGKVRDWLGGQFPQAKIEYLHQGICDCVRGSGFSVYRYAHDVLAKKPDLVLIDFASDDHQTDGMAVADTIEGVVRQTIEADPSTDLLFLYAFRSGFEASYDAGTCPAPVSGYERVAEHYAIPSVNMGHRVAELAREGKLAIKASVEEAQALGDKLVFSREGVRPTADADRIYAEVITEALGGLLTTGEPVPHALKAPYRKTHIGNAVQVAITEDMLEGDWEKVEAKVDGRDFTGHFDGMWFTKTPGAKLTFRFRGTEAALFDLMGPDTGQVRVTVDGVDKGVRKQVDPWSYYQRLAAIPLVSGAEDREHEVTVELLPEVPDRSVPIAEAKKANRYRAQDFEGVALRIGWIRLRGELME